MREQAAAPRWGLAPVGALAMTLLAVAGCANAENGSASPATAGGTQPAQQGSGAVGSTISLPPRPRSLPLTGVDPCRLLTAAQQAQLGVDPGVAGHPDVNWHNPQCGFQLTNPGTLPSYNLQTVTSAGIQFWLNPLLANNLKQVAIAGFPSVDVTSKASTATGCQTVVSVADGQMLIVQFDFPPTGMTAAQSCGNTEQAASAAVATLQTVN